MPFLRAFIRRVLAKLAWWRVPVEGAQKISGDGSETSPVEVGAAEPEPFQPPAGSGPPVLSGADFFFVGARESRSQLDRRQQHAMEQEFALTSGKQLSWRGSDIGSIVDLGDGREALRLEHPVVRPSAEEALRRLIGRRDTVAAALGPDADQIDLHWPTEVVLAFDGGVRGYLTTALDQSFSADVGGGRRAVRTLDFAIAKSDSVDQTLSVTERLELLSLVADWVRGMHAANVVHGRLGIRSAAFSTRPLRIAPTVYSSARVLGTRSWIDSAPGTGPSLDDDRRAFARLVSTLLVPEASSDQSRFFGIPSRVARLEPDTTARLRWLSARASGEQGTPPTMDEWAEALQRVARPQREAGRVSNSHGFAAGAGC